jgi:hypothetical protein
MKVIRSLFVSMGLLGLAACNSASPSDQAVSSSTQIPSVDSGRLHALATPCSTQTCSWKYLGSIKAITSSSGTQIRNPVLTISNGIPTAIWWHSSDANYCSQQGLQISSYAGGAWSSSPDPLFCNATDQAVGPAPTTTGRSIMVFLTGNQLHLVTGVPGAWQEWPTPVPTNGLVLESNPTTLLYSINEEPSRLSVVQTPNGNPTVAFSAYLASDPLKTRKIFIYRWQTNAWVNLGAQTDGSMDVGEFPRLAIRDTSEPEVVYRKPNGGNTFVLALRIWNVYFMRPLGNITPNNVFVSKKFTFNLNSSGQRIIASTEWPNSATSVSGPSQLMVRMRNDGLGTYEPIGPGPLHTSSFGWDLEPSVTTWGTNQQVMISYNSSAPFSGGYTLSSSVQEWNRTTQHWSMVGAPFGCLSRTSVAIRPNGDPMLICRNIVPGWNPYRGDDSLGAFAWNP